MGTMFSRWLKRKSLYSPAKLAGRRRPIWPSRGHLLLEALEARVVPTGITATVCNTNDSGPGSLRQAILDTNSAADASHIQFDIPGAGVQDIQLASALPEITTAVDIDGTTQPGYAGTPLIELNGSGAGYGVSGLVLSAPNCTVTGFDINGFSFNGVVLNAGSETIQANYLGTDPTGTFAIANGGNGITINNASGNTIGGLTSTPGTGAGNVISGNAGIGIWITGSGATGNVLEGNLIGTDITGAQALGNQSNGVQIDAGASGNTIGGTAPGHRNIISGNGTTAFFSGGIALFDAGTSNNLIEGNFIGTDVSGTSAVANGWDGIGIAFGPSSNTIGGTTVGARNIISGNVWDGIDMYQSGSANLVEGNFIGTDVTGTHLLGNQEAGVGIGNGSSGETVGGTASGAGNVISGNYSNGVVFYQNGSANLVLGNFIGTDVTGTSAIGNSASGIEISNSPNNTIGGTTPAARNVISGNVGVGVTGAAVDIEGAGATGNLVIGNYMGTDLTGTIAVPNLGWSAVLIGGAANNTIGGVTATPGTGAGNLISGNATRGITVYGGTNNLIAGNNIGLNAAGTGLLGNAAMGIEIGGGAGNTVGGVSAGFGNVISGNGGFYGGVLVSDATGTLIAGNLIGTDITGTVAIGNSWDGIELIGSSNNTIGGTTTAARNVISGNGRDGIRIKNALASDLFFGISPATGNLVEGNYIGTNAAGTAALANGENGVTLTDGAFANTIGGLTAIPGTAPGNLISGNNEWGISVSGDNNLIEGNIVGLDAAGTAPVRNGFEGIAMFGASGTTIGGVAAGARNIVSGNAGGYGQVYMSFGSTGTLVQGNFIGTDITGTLGGMDTTYGNGVTIVGVSDNTIGGTTAAAANVISGNANGILIINATDFYGYTAPATGNLVQGNFIGTDKTGTVAIPNLQYGISISADANTIGGTAEGAGNLISGNQQGGVKISAVGLIGNLFGGTGTLSAVGNVVQGNYIGTNETGTATVDPGYTLGASGAVSGDSGVAWNGSSGYVNLPASAFNYPTTGSTDSYSLSFETWFNAPAGSSGGVILGQTVAGSTPGGAGPSGYVPAIMLGTDGKLHAALFWHGGGDYMSSAATYNDGLWHQVAVTYSDGTETLYIDGALAASNTGAEISYASAYSYYLGTGETNFWPGGNGGWFFFKGQLDEAAIYSTALSGSQIAAHYGSAADGFAAYSAAVLADSPAAYYHLGDTSGTVAQDSSGNGLHAAYATGNGLGNGGPGIYVSGSDNIIGGTAAGAGNLISNNAGSGIWLNGSAASGNIVAGNLIGTDAAGTAALGNQGFGVEIDGGASANTIGGTVSGAGNVVSGNGANGSFYSGIELGDAGTANNVIAGNIIGLNAAGTAAIPNAWNGIAVTGGVSGTIIGGTTAGARNIISGNLTDGIEFFVGGPGNLVEGNFIGTDITGTIAIGNGVTGIQTDTGASGVTIGGTAAGAGNLISGNLGVGVGLYSGSSLVEGNVIGTDVTGTHALGNGGGVQLASSSDGNVIGGTAAGAGNLISGNLGDGIGLNSGSGVVEGNLIGTDVTGTHVLGNAGVGVRVVTGSTAYTIGGAGAGAGNVISGNGNNGIEIDAGDEVLIQGNFIGTDITGTIAVANLGSGVQIDGSATGITIGGTAAGTANIIAFNSFAGIAELGSTTTGNTIRGNSIHDNQGLGIDLNGDGVTTNDPGDADAGPNNLQNFPVLIGAVPGTTTSVSGSFNSTPNSTVTLDFYAGATADPSGYGQGQIFLGSTTVTTDSSGNATFVVTGLGLTTSGAAISATATDAGGNTSEFSADVTATSLTASAGGPYSTSEGHSVSLAGSGSDALGVPFTYSWTINGHAGAATGASPTLSWAQLQALGIDDGPNAFTVAVTISDGYGNSATSANVTLSLANTAPTASVAGPTIGVPGQPLSFTLGAADPSATDQAAGFTFSINWGDGHTESGDGLSGITDGHAYATPGTYIVSVSATDKDSGVSSAATHTVTVATMELEGGTLAVGGTTGNDSFVLTPVSATSIKVVLNGTNLGTFSNTALQLFGDGGTDTVTINGTTGDDTFTLAGITATVNGFTVGLNTMQSVTENGLAGNDSFTNTLAAIPSTLLGVGNNDTFVFAGGAMGASASISGGAGTNTLIAPDMVNLWTVTGANAGTLNGDSFTGIQNLTGGALADTFQMMAGGTLGGTLNGGGGTNSLDYSAYTTAVTANLQTGTAIGMAQGWSNLSSITGSSTVASTLTGPDSASTWTINGSNSGTVNSFTFAKFQNLTGGAGTNLFDFSGTGTIAGKLAGSGSNTLNYAGYGSPATVSLQSKTATGIGTIWASVVAFAGTGTSDTLVGPNAASAWTITGTNAGTVGAYSFSSFPNLTGGTGANTFMVGAGGSITGTLTGTSANNTLVAPNVVNTFAVRGTNAGSLDGAVIPSFVGIQSLTGGSLANTFVFSNGASLAGSISGVGSVTMDEAQLTSSVTANLQTHKVSGVTGTVTNLVSIMGGSAANLLTGANTTNTWTINGANSGSVNGVAFTNFGSLTGGTGTDTFAVGAAGSLNGALAGGGGTNTLVGPNIASTFAITGANIGSLNATVIPAFTQIQNLTGGSSSNRFVFSTGAHVTGSVDGGIGGGTLDYSSYTTNVSVNLQTNTVTGVTGTASNIVSAIGGSGNNTLTGPNGGVAWNLTGNNAGTINGAFTFATFANLTSGAGANAFVLSNGAGVTGNINGTAGSATLDYSCYTFGVSVNLQTKVVTAVGGKATGLVAVIGGSGSNALTGANTANTWNITGSNAGNINGTVAFTAFATLTGGSGSDFFVFGTGASVSGTITGKAGTNRLDYSGFGASVYVNLLTAAAKATLGIANIQQVYGSGMGDVLVGNGTGVTLVETAGKNLIIGGTGGGATLVSGSGEDIVIAGSTVYDNNQAALEAIEHFWATDGGNFALRVAALSAGIPGGFKLDASTVMHHTGAADTIALNSALDWLFWRSSGNGADNLTGTPGQGQQI